MKHIPNYLPKLNKRQIDNLDQLREIDLRGKIDRVDLAPYKNELLGQVIDYKSSSKNFDLALFTSKPE